MTDDLDQMGPIDYLVVEFPGNKMTGEAFPLLVDLVDRGIIRIIDLVFVRKDRDGSVAGLAIADLDGDGELDLAVFEGATSGLLGDDDIDEAGGVLEPGSSAGVLVYENVWAAPFAAAMRRGGGQLVASGRIPVQALLAALDAAERPPCTTLTHPPPERSNHARSPARRRPDRRHRRNRDRRVQPRLPPPSGPVGGPGTAARCAAVRRRPSSTRSSRTSPRPPSRPPTRWATSSASSSSSVS